MAGGDTGRAKVQQADPEVGAARARPSDAAAEDARREQDAGQAAPFWERAVAIVGLGLVLGVVGFMLYRAVAGDASPPTIAIAVDSVVPSGGEYLVAIRVANRGDVTVAGLVVEGELRRGSEIVETSTATISYVPARSQRRAGLFFERDPRQLELRLRPTGYEQP